MTELWLGTSGWEYKDWVGPFYPPKLPKTQWLPFLAEQALTVEIDSTFYSPPRQTTVEKWSAQTPEHFRFSPKLSRAITHEAKLRDCRPLLEAYCTAIRAFGPKLGAICVQLPPYFTASRRADLETFCTWLPADLPFAIEFRHVSWFTPDMHQLLAAYNIAWVNSDNQTEVVFTAPFTYIRLLGDHDAISEFDRIQTPKDAELIKWARLLARISPRIERVYAYVNNHFEGHSPETLRRLRQRLAEAEAELGALEKPSAS